MQRVSDLILVVQTSIAKPVEHMGGPRGWPLPSSQHLKPPDIGRGIVIVRNEDVVIAQELRAHAADEKARSEAARSRA
jgi:hypothetical protein